MIRDAVDPPPPHTLPALRPEVGPVPDAAGVVPPPLELNPRLRIEPALNLVVLEFRDHAGEVSRSIPTAREIEAYRCGAEPGGEAPAQPRPGVDVTR
jgi:hypothetical protein